MEEKIALYTLVTDSYFESALVLICSFLTNNDWFDGDIIILYPNGKNTLGLGEWQKNYFIEKFGSVIKFQEIDISKYIGIFNHIIERKFSPFTLLYYFKFEMFKKDEYSMKLYLDSDVVVNKCIREMFRTDCDKVLVVRDAGNKLSNYFNAGMMFVPMSLIPDDFYEKIMNIAATADEDFFKNKCTGKGQYGDQDILNEIMPEKEFISEEYNVSPCAIKINYDDIEHYKIFHYYGNIKPWRKVKDFEPADFLYFRYYHKMLHENKETYEKKRINNG